MKIVARTVQFSDEMYERLKKLADEMDIPISAVIKVACNEYIKKQEKNQENK